MDWVIDLVKEVLEYAIHRLLHFLDREATKMYKDCRKESCDGS